MKVYKIQNTKTGLFSTGGMRPRWTKQGKVWQELSYVHRHIGQLTYEYSPADVYNDAVIVEAEITEILLPLEPANKHLIKKMDDIVAHHEERIKKYPNDTYYPKWLEEARGRRALMK